jgi:hypothetical protein
MRDRHVHGILISRAHWRPPAGFQKFVPHVTSFLTKIVLGPRSREEQTSEYPVVHVAQTILQTVMVAVKSRCLS